MGRRFLSFLSDSTIKYLAKNNTITEERLVQVYKFNPRATTNSSFDPES